MQGYLILAMLSALLVVTFAVQNAAAVDLRFMLWTFTGISLALVIAGAIAVGAIIAFLFGMPKQFKLLRRLKEAQSHIKKLQDEIKGAQAGQPPEEQLQEDVPFTGL